MTSGYPFVQCTLDDPLSTDLKNADEFCFSCEQIFSSRKCLEEHLCPVPFYICSCGTEFTSYKHMLDHNSTHEPGYQVLCHDTIKKRRIEKHWEEEEKLQRLQSGEIIWESPKSLPIKAASQRTMARVKMSQTPGQSLQPLQVPGKYSQAAPPTMVQNVSSSDTSKIFSDVGAPTVDLWTLFQPVVVVPAVGTSSKTKTYTCGKCGQSFVTKKSLVIHHSTSHNVDKISGCIGCGLLLSSRKIVPRFHSCNSPHVQISNYKFKLITARPLNPITPNIANGQGLAAVSSPSLKASNYGVYRNNINLKHSVAKQPVNSVPTKTFISSASLSKVNNPTSPQTAPGVVGQPLGKGFECRVCHIVFESVGVLQRHKCAKAHEFLMKHKLTPANRQRQMVPMRIPNSSLQNIGKQSVFSTIGSTNIQNKMSDLDKKETPVCDNDDDCFIVESGQEKPAEVIYQVTSSVPIKT